MRKSRSRVIRAQVVSRKLTPTQPPLVLKMNLAVLAYFYTLMAKYGP